MPLIITAVISVVVIGVLIFLLVQANNDITSAEDALAEAEEATSQSEQQVADLEDQLSVSEDQASALQAEVDAAEEVVAAAKELEAETAALNSSVTDFLALSMTQGLGVEASDATCLADAVIEDLGAAAVMDSFLESFADPNAFSSPVLSLGVSMFGAAEECGVSLDGFGLGPTGDTYGDDPTLDVLWDACADGSGAACDQLYFTSPLGSEYERFGGTCGDRFPSLATSPASCEGEI